MTEKKHSVLITGASRGIGRAIALELARQGFNIVLNFRRQKAEAQAVLEIIESLDQQARLLPFDVSDREQAVSAIEKDIEIHGAYYGVVCNAGITRDNVFPSMSGEEWDDVLKTNLGGFYNVVQPCIMPMVRTKQGGRIVMLSSVAGLIGNRGQVNNTAFRGTIINLTTITH
jgi:3-oxoacyl-[acyl-carrier protein] reductase